MNYDVSSLFEVSSCRIVLVKDTQTALDLAKAVTQCNPDYHDRINDVFTSRVGVFNRKNKKTIWDILKKTKTVKEEGVEFLQQQIERMDIQFYKDRYPGALSRLQKERASVLYDTLCGRTQFLLSDCISNPDSEGYVFIKSNNHYFTIADFLNTYHSPDRRKFDLIWITGMPQTVLLDYLMDNDFFTPVYSIFSLQGETVVKCDKQELISEIIPGFPEINKFCNGIEERQLTAAQKFEEGRKCDCVSAAGANKNPENAKREFLWYAAAALDGYLPAQNMLGRFYEYGHDVCEVDLDRALFWYAKAAFHKKYDERFADQMTRYAHNAAEESLQRLANSLPDAENQILHYGGKAGEAVIQRVKLEQELAGKNFFDPEYVRRCMEEFKQNY